MRANRGRDTKPELAVRRRLHELGYRFRVCYRIEGTTRSIDIAFPRHRVAVFVDGCFWHGCPEHYRPARRNSDFWDSKLRANRARDLDTDALLQAREWAIVRSWEHEDVDQVVRRVAGLLRSVAHR
jgi:DNA mismatch endonuclease (patch repair protein)